MIIKTNKHCYFCATNAVIVDYKDTQMLKKFITPQAKINRKKKTGTCSLHQRKLSQAIKRARFLGIMPYVSR
jgi:small subunit ribosomal protein S18